MELTEDLKRVFIETAMTLKGYARRRFMAQTVKAFGAGGASLAERALGWNRGVIRKGMHELESGLQCIGDTRRRRPKRAEERLPNLLADIQALVDGQSQTDPQFRSNRLYTRLTAAEVRRQLIAQTGYTDAELPTVRTLLTKLNALGYHPTKVAKAKPKKKLLKPTPSLPD
jgi:Rhodopirellula transposase DDE domain